MIPRPNVVCCVDGVYYAYCDGTLYKYRRQSVIETPLGQLADACDDVERPVNWSPVKGPRGPHELEALSRLR